MPRTFTPPPDDCLNHLTEKDALERDIRHGLTGGHYTFHVRRGVNEAGDTALLRTLENKFGVVLGFNNGTSGVSLAFAIPLLQK